MRGKRTYWRRVVAAVVLLPLVVLASSFAHHLMRCRLTGVIVPSCVCPDDTASPGSDPAMPTVAEQSCCERESVEALAVGREEDSRSVVPIPLPIELRGLILADVGAIRRRNATPSSSIRVRPPGPSLVLLKRSFLI
jgi:hypothetical protein